MLLSYRERIWGAFLAPKSAHLPDKYQGQPFDLDIAGVQPLSIPIRIVDCIHFPVRVRGNRALVIHVFVSTLILAIICARSLAERSAIGVSLGLLKVPFSSSEYIEWCQLPQPATLYRTHIA